MKKAGIFLLAGIVSLNLLVIILYLFTPINDPLLAVYRLFALLGLVALFISAILTPFQKELYQMYKKPFLKIHHSSAIVGLCLITAHPILFAIDKAIMTGSASEGARVFIPVFSSAYDFWALAGRPAFYLLYIALIGFFLRKIFKKGWRAIHSLNYVALIFGVVHGIIIGSDFYNFAGPVNVPQLLMTLLFILMTVATIITFTIKRIRMMKQKKKKKSKEEISVEDQIQIEDTETTT